ncbi:MAG: hypothetical protein ACREVR_14885, partial [Burkholderiales bacterium]
RSIQAKGILPDIPLDDGAGERAVSLKLREADLTKHLTDNPKDAKDEEQAKAVAAAATHYNFTPAPRPKDIDEILTRPQPGAVVSEHDYELNQAIAFLKSRGGDIKVAN